MVMITPAEFEDEMIRISQVTNVRNRNNMVIDLICRTLDDNGYSSGIKIFKEVISWQQLEE